MVVEYNIAGISRNEDYCAGRAASALAGLPVHWQGETIEYSLMRCIMDPLLILNRRDQLKSQDLPGYRNIRYDIRNSGI
jgi:hypothetical protein